jgi:hypothetical protein
VDEVDDDAASLDRDVSDDAVDERRLFRLFWLRPISSSSTGGEIVPIDENVEESEMAEESKEDTEMVVVVEGDSAAGVGGKSSAVDASGCFLLASAPLAVRLRALFSADSWSTASPAASCRASSSSPRHAFALRCSDRRRWDDDNDVDGAQLSGGVSKSDPSMAPSSSLSWSAIGAVSLAPAAVASSPEI